MHPRAERFAEAAAEEYGLAVEVREFEEGTRTAQEAAEAIGCKLAQIASSLVFVVGGEPVVVITSGANRVSEERLAALIGDADAAVALAGPEEVKAATGWSIGGVPPICHEAEVPVLVDETLLEHEEVWAAAGTPEAVWPVHPRRLLALSGATPAKVAE